MGLSRSGDHTNPRALTVMADALFRVTEGAGLLSLDRSVELSRRLPVVAASVALPYDALYDLDRIYLLEDERMGSVLVERLGEVRASDGSRRVIVRSDELEAGARVIVTQLANASDGLEVQVAPARIGSGDSTG